MSPLRLWMKFSLRLALIVNFALGVVLIGLQHEACKILGIYKPADRLPLQLAGLTAVLLAIGYGLVARNPIKFRYILAVSFVLHAAASAWIADAVSGEVLPGRFLAVVILITFVDLIPIAIIAPRLFPFAGSSQRSSAAPEPVRHAISSGAGGASRKASWIIRTVWAAMFLGIVLPPSVCVAHVVNEMNARAAARLRPAKWTPLKAHLPSDEDELFSYRTIDVWPKLRFVDPTFVCPIPDQSGRMAVIERAGRIQVFSAQGAEAGNAKTQVWLDISDRTMQVQRRAEDGLLGLAFHPHFTDPQSPQRGWIFVRYTANVGGQRSNRLSRFIVPDGSDRPDPKSEKILIELPEQTCIHKGGAAAFGPDGFLYTTFGTDGSTFPGEHAQRIDQSLWAGVLRIDVDCQGGEISHPPLRQPEIGKTAGYFIPNDNPFVGKPRAMEEFYSIGFRNPWRMSIDPKTGLVWVGDVGDRQREEIDICSKGSNHQWDYMEGTLPTRTYASDAPERPTQPIGRETPPIFEYQHEGLLHCVIGGYVYRGKKFPELVGKYVYADQCGRIFALTVDDHQHFVKNELIAAIRDPGMGVSSMGQDADGELYLCCIYHLAMPGSYILRLDRAVERADGQFPKKLSATGLFNDTKSLTPNPALISYEVNVPLWSDRAEKQRWIGLPSAQKIDGDRSGRWSFPKGTVFVKHFELPLDERNKSDGVSVPTRRVETRVLVCDDRGGVFGATYRWNEDQSDADLVTSAATEEISYLDEDGHPQTQIWSYPGRIDCQACHNDTAGGVLGFNARQLNREVVSDGLSDDQMYRFSRAGMFAFDCSRSDLTKMPKLHGLADVTVGLEERVRSYLDANCSHCHQPGSRYGLWDGRIETPLYAQKIVGGRAITHTDKNPNAVVVQPGDLSNSFLYTRLSSTEPHLRMPALAHGVVDQQAVELVRQWILSLPPIADISNPKDESVVGQDP